MGLNLIPKASLKDEDTQQPGNLNNVGLKINYKQLQNQLQHFPISNNQFFAQIIFLFV